MAAAEPPKRKGTVGFDWHKPKASRGATVTGALLTKLTNDYPVRPRPMDSAKERNTQLANGE